MAALLGGSMFAAIVPGGTAAHAQAAPSATSEGQAQATTVAQRLRLLEEQLKGQQALIEAQSQLIAQQRSEIEAMKVRMADDDALVLLRGRGLAQAGEPAAATPQPAPSSAAGQSDVPPDVPDRPVGEAPAQTEESVQQKVAAVPEGLGVLTPPGTLVIDPNFEFVQSATDRLVFRGFELIPGIQIGVIEASKADRDTIVETGVVRYGLTNRLEIEARMPLVYRSDRIEVVQQRDEGIVRTIGFKETNIGDAELSLRYQINAPRKALHPIFVTSLRVKAPTGKGPFDIDYDEFGVATGLATGSGFWAVQPGVNFLLPSDPVVIYGSLAYLYHIPAHVNRNVGGAFVGRVDPGDAISGNLGFGFALNPRFSFSLGYRHAYIFPTYTDIGDVRLRSNRLHVGSFNFGMSYRLSERQSVNFGFEFGMTQDAPDVAVTIRFPFAIPL